MNKIDTITTTEALKKEIDNIRRDILRSKSIVQILEKSLLDFRQTKSKIEERLMINRSV